MGILDQRGRLEGRKAVVVGGAGGIGRAITLALAQAGVDCAFCDVDGAAVKRTRDEVAGLGRQALGCIADATVSAQLEGFYREASAFFGSADIVVNVVGGTLMQPFMQRSAADCAQDIQRNFGYVIESVRLAVPLLRRSGRGGCIVNFTTIEAHRGAGGFSPCTWSIRCGCCATESV